VRRISENFLTPFLNGEIAMYKTIADGSSNVRLWIASCSDVVTEDFKSISIQLANPTLD
jgi:hypothetical protein